MEERGPLAPLLASLGGSTPSSRGARVGMVKQAEEESKNMYRTEFDRREGGAR